MSDKYWIWTMIFFLFVFVFVLNWSLSLTDETAKIRNEIYEKKIIQLDNRVENLEKLIILENERKKLLNELFLEDLNNETDNLNI